MLAHNSVHNPERLRKKIRYNSAMDEPTANKIILATHWPRLMAACALGMLAIFLLVLTIGELKSYRYIGSGITPTNTITVDGEGIAYAVPDTATFTVTVEDTAP